MARSPISEEETMNTKTSRHDFIRSAENCPGLSQFEIIESQLLHLGRHLPS